MEEEMHVSECTISFISILTNNIFKVWNRNLNYRKIQNYFQEKIPCKRRKEGKTIKIKSDFFLMSRRTFKHTLITFKMSEYYKIELKSVLGIFVQHDFACTFSQKSRRIQRSQSAKGIRKIL